MNERRYEFARHQCIQRLPEPERSVYLFVEKRELSLADEAVSENHYVRLLQQQSPIFAAAEHFKMEAAVVFETVQRIEASLEAKVSEYEKRLKLIDYTDEFRLQGLCLADERVKYYFLV
ncbi:hypothetical protein [Alteribacter keqinensis]|uniref:Uncharacterized protein n=1 Tax=Alteribacter keqinensis TaxID=2483800 RepID=A0A3M7TXF4_9BACI|nr:hypothetical protein [Alteribacter keqinensis]RNA69961.1 hypothetical protein EBO34_08525 [Alteribacter keqinensis]